jgi:uncharacterized phage-associated protein
LSKPALSALQGVPSGAKLFDSGWYGEFKQWQWNPIADDPGFPSLPRGIKEHLEEIMQVYGVHTAYHLERLTHRDDPWRDARGDLPPDAPCTTEISHEAMSRYFKAQLATA